MLSRRKFFILISRCTAPLIALSPSKIFASLNQAIRQIVNDVHSQLNPTKVLSVETPSTINALVDRLREAFSQDLKVSVSGTRHSMGGQQFGTDTLLIDTRSLNRVIGLDRNEKVVEVEAGIAWPKLIAWLNQNAPELSIIQKQTGADELTLGGALASNIHGRGLTRKPIINDVESFTLVTAIGAELECSRHANQELFGLAIGGYGLFGIIVKIKLRLNGRIAVERVVESRPVKGLSAAIDQRIAQGYLFGDLQYMTDASADGFMREGVFSCYKPAEEGAEPAGENERLSLEDWQNLYFLAHVDKGRAFRTYRDYYLGTNGQIYWSDQHQMSTYLKDQNKVLDRMLAAPNPTSLMISELYVPRDKLTEFMEHARAAAIEQDMSIIYGTIRFIEKDNESFLAWAKEPYACIIFNLHIVNSPEGIEKAKTDFRRLIDEALKLGGSYYLTYHRWARKDQLLTAYPQFEEFMDLKLRYDPEERFTSDWYRYHKSLLELEDPRITTST